MNKLTLVFCLILASFNSFASDVCKRTQKDIKLALTTKKSRIAFKNQGGMIDGGVCWWHSRLQRSAAYLAQFEPDLPSPTDKEVKEILTSLKKMNRPVIIPGYHDFYSFSSDYQKEIQQMLEEWQRVDGFLNFQWIRGISGRSSLPSGKMEIRMERIFDYYKSSPTPLWIMAQIKGITSHSFLILNMSPRAQGYSLFVIDSNHPSETLKFEYRRGETSLRGKNNSYRFVPYAGFQKDFKKISYALRINCDQETMISEIGNIMDGEVEVD